MLNLVGSACAGILFAVSWWLLIDAAVVSSHLEIPVVLQWYEYIPAVGSSIFLFMINLVSLDHMIPSQTDIFITNNNAPTLIKIWLFVWFTMSFVAIGGAISIMAVKYSNYYLGWAVVAQPIIVLASAVLWLFTRRNKKPVEDPMMM